MRNKLIIVSNRLPFRIEKKGGVLEVRQSTGGLVSSMDAALSKFENVIWVGCADFSQDLWMQFRSGQQRVSQTIVPVFISKAIEKRYYDGFSNSVIWPLFHYFPSYAVFRETDYSAYEEVNRTFAEVVAEVASANDTVWVHDYHLMLLPGMLREMGRGFSVGFFLHIPFPSYEILKQIPESWRTAILMSLLKADVMGVHTKEYVSHFKRALAFFLGAEVGSQIAQHKGLSVLVKDYPISIDFSKFNRAFDQPAVVKGRHHIRSRHKNVKIVFSVDRLDYTKGVLNRLQAFEELLSSRSDLRQKVTFIINVVPSREKHRKYVERRRLIEEQVGHINGLFGNVSWTAVIYQYGHLTFQQLLSFYTDCDVALVTPLRDGMNLVAKEFVASRKDMQGVLVLSEFAGAAQELKEAILVNPNDAGLMKNAMLQALDCPSATQRVSMERMQATVKENDARKWSLDFLRDLSINSEEKRVCSIKVMDFDDRLRILEAGRQARQRIIFLDYDGTLVPYFDDPKDAKPHARTKDLLRKLSTDKCTTVVIISGRDSAVLQEWFCDVPVCLVAEHGAYYRLTGDDSWTETVSASETWKAGVRAVFEKYADFVEGSMVEEKKHAVTWHYRKAKLQDEESVVDTICRELMISNATGQFNVLRGNKIIEAKNIHCDKGTFVAQFLKEHENDFVLAIGDDATDEDMFSVLRNENHFSIRVGLTKTVASFNLIGAQSVYSFLEQICAMRSPTRYSSAVAERT